jgi:hypothetical protein
MTHRIMATALLSAAALGGALFTTAATLSQDPQPPSPGAQRLNEAPDLAALEAAGFSSGDIRRIIRGFQIAPVRLNLRGKDLGRVGLGSYIVNAQGGCNDCHTNPPFAEGGDPFQGQPKRINAERYLAGGMAFGPFISRNLTPDEQGRPAGLTFNEFRRVLRTGVDLDHAPPHVPSEENDLLQVMPWPIYGEMLDEDMRSIYEFLRAIPSRPNSEPAP